MKRKKKIFVIIFMLAFFLMIGNVSAAEDKENMCTPTQLSELRSMAANVKVTYVPVTEAEKLTTPNGESGAEYVSKRYLDIKIFNLNTKLIVNAKNGIDSFTITSNDIGGDGAVTIRQPASTSAINYEFEVTSLLYGCSLETLRTIKLTLPKYNYYSQLDVCDDIPDYYLCQPYTTYSVDGGTFYDKVDEYKAKLSSAFTPVLSPFARSLVIVLLIQEGTFKICSSATSSILKFSISKYKYLIVGIVVVVGVVLTIFVLKKKGSAL